MGSNRPAWMEGGTQKPKAPTRPIPQESPPLQPTTHRNLVIGITLLAVITLFSTFFWVGFGLVSVINPPSASLSRIMDGDSISVDDYFSIGRVLIATIVGVIGTAAAWSIADIVID